MNCKRNIDNNGVSLRTENATKTDVGLGSLLFNSMKKHWNKVLQYVDDTDETDTNEQVLIRSIRTAIKLKEKGINKGDIISTCTHNHKNSCVPLAASCFIGAIPANFDPDLSHLDTIHLLKLVQPKILFVSTQSLPLMEKCLIEANVATELVVFGTSKKYSQFSEYLEPRDQETNFRVTPIYDDRETAVILFSSGTTGLPKGICLSHYSLVTQAREGDYFLTKISDERDIHLVYTTFYWITALLTFIATVHDGGARVVCAKFDPYNCWKMIEKYKVTVMFMAPHLAAEIVHHHVKDADVSSLKIVAVGGFNVTAKLMQDLNTVLPQAVVLNGYGQTECACAIAKFNWHDPKEVAMQIRKPSSSGKINKRLLWKVVDLDTEQILGPNQSGELRLKSDSLMSGYYKMDSSSAYDSEGYLKTGDRVYYDEEGCLFVTGRVKEMFKYKGWHIVPAILEEVLMSHPAVKEAAVAGVPHETDGEHPMGLVVLHDGFKHVTPTEIEQFVEERVSEAQRLRAGVKIVDNIERTATGKINRRRVKNLLMNANLKKKTVPATYVH